MHSWRVLILPFLEQKELYDAYRFDEPWDGPNNAKMAGRIGNIYRRPEDSKDGSTRTRFVAVVGAETAFPFDRSLKMEEIGDGTSNTIMFVEVADADVPWMAPVDLRFDGMSFRINDPSGKGLGSPYGGARIAMMDGTIVPRREDLDPKILRAWLTANGGETIRETSTGWAVEPPTPKGPAR